MHTPSNFGQFHVETFGNFPDTQQLYAAGYLEGYLTAGRHLLRGTVCDHQPAPMVPLTPFCVLLYSQDQRLSHKHLPLLHKGHERQPGAANAMVSVPFSLSHPPQFGPINVSQAPTLQHFSTIASGSQMQLHGSSVVSPWLRLARTGCRLQWLIVHLTFTFWKILPRRKMAYHQGLSLIRLNGLHASAISLSQSLYVEAAGPFLVSMSIKSSRQMPTMS